MCCSYWLTNKAALAYGMAEYSQNGKEIYRVARVKEMPCKQPDATGTFLVNYSPVANTQISRNGFI